MNHTSTETKKALSNVAEQAKTQLIEPAQTAMANAVQDGEQFARQQGEELERWVARQPLTAIGAAFGAGLLAAAFIRLKH